VLPISVDLLVLCYTESQLAPPIHHKDSPW
jgi:hypothetical protein